jgi:hypothetical protein
MIDDLIILGRAVPETIKNGRTTICTAGYSKSLGFVRIYPTKHTSPLTQWNIVKVPVERDPRDTRRESWKIQGSKSEWGRLDEKIEIIDGIRREDRLNLIANLVDDCVKNINDEMRSFGIVKPTIKERYFSETADYDPSIQTTLFGPPPPKSKKQYPEIPKIKYCCSKCRAEKPHDMTVLEWGFYEWLRKHPDKIDQVWENALLDSPSHEIFFLLGNMLRYRNAFLIISVLRLPKGPVSKPLIPLIK